MEKFVVITTIHPKSEGIARFEQMKDWQVVLVGDRKSAPVKSSENLVFLSVEDQQNLGYEFVKVCPYDHYSRKNIGYLYAIQQGADIIYDTDDDNVPYDHWGLPAFESDQQLASQRRFVNVYRHFTDELIWPRGYPLDEIQHQNNVGTTTTATLDIGVWQGLADLAPDVDAIYRLVFGKQIRFRDEPSVSLSKGCYCPFNSQNTFWHERAFPYLYLPATTSFRFTDILRGYVAQRLMWQYELYLGFTRATVYQDRNAHDLMRDFADEVRSYLDVKSIVALLDSLTLSLDQSLDVETVYCKLSEQGFVMPEEVAMCHAWLTDLKNIKMH